MRDIITRHQDCSRCGELQEQLYLVGRERGIITAKLSEGSRIFGHWAKITRKDQRHEVQ